MYTWSSGDKSLQSSIGIGLFSELFKEIVFFFYYKKVLRLKLTF